MPLKLFAPGTRKGNRFWIARGRIAGQRVEISTRELDKGNAERVAARFVLELLERGQRGPDRARTFAEAVEAYVSFRRPELRDEQRLAALCQHIGALEVGQVTQAELVHAVQACWPGQTPASWNRNGIAPAAAVLHYAASNKWCGYMRVARFREPPPVARALSEDDCRRLVAAAAAGAERRLVLLLFGLAQRITDTCRLDWSQVDLESGVAHVAVSKVGRVLTLPLPPALAAELARVAPAQRRGPVLPYGNRWAAYEACAAIGARAGVRWTPHQARHAVGTALARQGASLRAIMATLGHANVKSSIRYQAADLAMIRQAQGLAALTEPRKRKAKR